MGDKDKGTCKAMRIGWMRKGIATVVPNLKICFIFRPSTNKCLAIRYDIISFMPVNIYTVLCFAISPLYFYKPLLCCRQQYIGLMNPLPQEQVLQFFACDNVTNILGFNKAGL